LPDPILIVEAASLAAIAAAIIAWLVGRQARLPGGAIGAGVGVLVGAWVLALAPRVPPRDALDRFLLLVLPVAVLAETLAATNGRVRWAGWALRVLVAASATPVLVSGSSYVTDLSGPGSREWAPREAATIFIGLAVSLVLIQTLLSRLANRASRSTAIAVAMVTGGAAVTVMLSGYATGGQLAFPIATTVGVFAVLGYRHTSGAVAIVILSLFSLLVVGRLFAGVTTQHAVVLFAAPLLTWIPELPWFHRVGPGGRAMLRVNLPAIPVLLTLWLAQQEFTADSTGPGKDASGSSLNDYMNYGK